MKIEPKKFILSLSGILLVSLLVRLVFLSYNLPLWWDSHVYVGMSKYFFSQGTIGLWEMYRPLLHPLILGVFWKLGLNVLIVGKTLDVLFSLASIALTYIIAKDLYDKRTAQVAGYILSLTPLFIAFTGLILTEPLAIFLMLLGMYVFIKKEWHFIAGVCIGLSFLTKFPQGIALVAIGGAILCKPIAFKKKIVQATALTSGFILTVLPYFVSNYYLYGSVLLPLKEASAIVQTATWLYGSGLFYYFWYFFLAYPIYLAVFPYLYSFYKTKEYKEYKKTMIVLVSVLTFVYFLTVARKESRYMITLLPFFAIMSAQWLTKTYVHLKDSSKQIIKASGLVVISLVVLLAPLPSALHFEATNILEKETAATLNKETFQGVIASRPFPISYTNIPVHLLSGMQYANSIYEKNKNKNNLIYLNTCDLPCAPNDTSCEEEKKELIEKILKEYQIIYQKTHKKCQAWVLRT